LHVEGLWKPREAVDLCLFVEGVMDLEAHWPDLNTGILWLRRSRHGLTAAVPVASHLVRQWRCHDEWSLAGRDVLLVMFDNGILELLDDDEKRRNAEGLGRLNSLAKLNQAARARVLENKAEIMRRRRSDRVLGKGENKKSTEGEIGVVEC
jgi:hypothetical protein